MNNLKKYKNFESKKYVDPYQTYLKDGDEIEGYFVADKHRARLMDSDLDELANDIKNKKRNCPKVFKSYSATKAFMHKGFYDDSDYQVVALLKNGKAVFLPYDYKESSLIKNLEIDPYEEEDWSVDESKDIDPYDEENWNDEMSVMSQEDFDAEKNILLNNLNIMIDRYGEFTKNVSPRHWRTSGNHFRYLREIRGGLQAFTLITPEEKIRAEELDR